ncbi:hypothetical protein L1887_47749 [Cichorium endivia]|nr:hypothetical protein L1887_47749 [Cichorium endivia]
MLGNARLVGRRRDEEPLVDAGVDGRRWLRVGLGHRGDGGVVGADKALGALDGGVGEADLAGVGLARDEALPGLVALVHDLGGVLAVLGLAGEGELVLGLAVGDLVDAEPLVGGADEAGQVALDVLNVVELGGERVVDVDDNHLPVGLALVEERHDAEHLDLLDLAGVADLLADLAHVERVVVALGLGVRVRVVRVLPRLREGAVVPDVALVREAVAHKAQLALLGVLLEGVEVLLLADLHLGVGPARDLDNHVEHRLALVGEQRHIVERRRGQAGLGVLEEDAVVERVGRTHGARLVVLGGSHGVETVGQLASGLRKSTDGGAGTNRRRHIPQSG